MSKYSDWRTDLREVMDDDTDNKKVTGKGVNNNKLIKINPKLGEAVEEIGGQILEMKEVDDADDKIEKDADADKKAAMADKVKKKEAMLKKRIVRMKMMAVNQGAADSIVAGYEPEGEVIDEAERSIDDRLDRKRKLYKKTTRKAMDYARREGEAAGHARYRMSSISREIDKLAAKKNVKEGVMKFIKDRIGGKKSPEKKANMDKTTDKLHTWRKSTSDKQKEHEKYVNFLPVDEEVVTERLGGKGYKPYTSLTGKKVSGDWEDSDRGAGNKATKRAGGKVEKKSPTYKAHVLNKEEVVTELNRYGKETGKATGSLNKKSGSPVATRNEPASPVNTVRRMIRKDTGRPEGQQKKVKGAKGLSQPGDRRFTPAQTISRMRAQVAAADASMRDTRGT